MPPEVGRSKPAIRFSSVDLPEPELPSSATNSPGAMEIGHVVDGAHQCGAHLIVARHVVGADSEPVVRWRALGRHAHHRITRGGGESRCYTEQEQKSG